MLRWPVQLRILLSNVRKFNRIAFYLRTVFLDKVLSAFRVYQQAGNAFFTIDRSSLFHQKLRIIFLNAPIISNGNVAHTLSLCVRASSCLFIITLALHPSTSSILYQVLYIRYCHSVKVPFNRMFQAARGNCKFNGILIIFTCDQAVNHCTGKAITTADTILHR